MDTRYLKSGSLIHCNVEKLLHDYLLSVAENSKLVFTHFSCQSKGKLDFVEGKYKITEVIFGDGSYNSGCAGSGTRSQGATKIGSCLFDIQFYTVESDYVSCHFS